MFRNQIIAAVRTGVAALVTWLLFLLSTHGVAIPAGAEGVLVALLFALCVALYNFIVNLLATHVNPLFGVLLGVPKSPTYNGSSGGKHLASPAPGPADSEDAGL